MYTYKCHQQVYIYTTPTCIHIYDANMYTYIRRQHVTYIGHQHVNIYTTPTCIPKYDINMYT